MLLKSNLKFKNTLFNAARRRFLCATFLLPLLFAATRAETVFVASPNAAQTTPTNNSAATGFVVIVLNNAETEVRYIAQYSNLSGGNIGGFIKIAQEQKDSVFAGIVWLGGSPKSGNDSFEAVQPVTPEQVAQLRGGRWFITINSAEFPNGEIIGRFAPYSAFAATLNGAQVVPPTNSAGSGRALIALDKTGRQAAVWFGYQNMSANVVAGFVDAGISGTNGVSQFIFLGGGLSSAAVSLRFLRQRQIGITPNEADLMRRGQLYLRLVDQSNQTGAGEIRGQIKPLNKFVDFDGDNRADISVFRPQTGFWYWLNSSNNRFHGVQWGIANDDIRCPADFDGDGLTDHAVWRQSSRSFYVLRSSDGTVRIQQWGSQDPIFEKPRPADYDGDGKADFAVFRKGTRTLPQSYFYILESNTGSVRVVPWRTLGGFSIPGDFDGDRTEDLTVVSNVNGARVYYTRLSSNGALQVQQWGAGSEHYSMTGDFDGDTKTDYVAFTFLGANVGNWWVLGSTAGVSVTKWGGANDDDFDPADYDGDGKTDFAVYRDSIFYIRRSTDGSLSAVRFGTSADRPLTGFPF